jgi:hypothetical protein
MKRYCLTCQGDGGKVLVHLFWAPDIHKAIQAAHAWMGENSIGHLDKHDNLNWHVDLFASLTVTSDTCNLPILSIFGAEDGKFAEIRGEKKDGT